MKKKFFANLWLTFHSWSPFRCFYVYNTNNDEYDSQLQILLLNQPQC
jgi:hypothetical protein